jgi:uncharacterized protein (TIGR02117 family)
LRRGGEAARALLSRIRQNKAARILAWMLGGLFAFPLGFLLFALVLGTVPANWGWQEAERGVTVFVRSNGVHTWIVMPKVGHGVDWRPYAPAEHLRDPRYGAVDHVAIGYGNRDFYLNTPTWGDLSARTALAAFFGNGPTLLHVEHDHAPSEDAHQRAITLTPDEYRRLASFISARFELDPAGRSIPVLGRGYGGHDMFYHANGGYSFVLTCNEWTGRALRAAGVRTGLWTPLEQSIMWRLD